MFSARFCEQDEDQVLDEVDSYISLNINKNLTESDIDNIDVRSQIKQQIQNQEVKDSDWRFDKVTSMTVYFFWTTEVNPSTYVKILLRSSAILNFEKGDYCFIWSILASLHPGKYNHPNRVSNYRQFFSELDIDGFDFTDGFKCSDVHKFEKLNNLSIFLFEISLSRPKWMEA